MKSRVQVSIESSQSTVILIAQSSLFVKHLATAIEGLHLQVRIVHPDDIALLTARHEERKFFSESYLCLWVDLPIFVSQSQKQEKNEQVLKILKQYLHIPLHLVTFDAFYSRKNGREGQIPTIASRKLTTSVLEAFPSVEIFNYQHVFYPYEGGLSLVQRFILEKIEQGKMSPLEGECSPLWYTDVISHQLTTLYDLSIHGGVFEGKTPITFKRIEEVLRQKNHLQSLQGSSLSFPFSFETGKSLGKISPDIMLAELSLIVVGPREYLAESKQKELVFTQERNKPQTLKKKKKKKKILRGISFLVSSFVVGYIAICIYFFSLLGGIRTEIASNSRTSSGEWGREVVQDIKKKNFHLLQISSLLPLPYSLVGIHLPAEGVQEGFRSVEQLIRGVEAYHQATNLLTQLFIESTTTQEASSTSTDTILSLLDESYKDLSAIQAQITKGNPIFDSLFGVDGLSSQLVSSTLSFREAINQEKALVSLAQSILRNQDKSIVLLVLVDEEEARPLVGTPREFVFLTFEQGKLIEKKMYTASELDAMLKGVVDMPKELQAFGLSSGWKLSDGAWSVDGPTSARQIAWFVSKQLHIEPDNIFFFDSTTLRKAQLALREQEGSLASNSNIQSVLGVQSEKHSFSEVFQEIEGKSLEQLNKLTGVVVESLNSSQSVLFSKDPNLTKSLRALAWDGGVHTPSCPSPFTVERRCTVLTRYVSEYDVDLGIEMTAERVQKVNQVHRMTISSALITHTDSILYPSFSGVEQHKILKYLIDPSAVITSLLINGETFPLNESYLGTEFGKTSITVPITLAPQKDTTISLSYTTPSIQNTKSSLAFFVQKQTGKEKEPFSLEVTYDKDYRPLVVAPKADIERSVLSFTTELDKSKVFAIGF